VAQIDKGVATSFKDATGAILTAQGTNAEEWWGQLTDVLTLGGFPDPEGVARQIVQDCLGPYYRSNGQAAAQTGTQTGAAAAPMGAGVGPAPAPAPVVPTPQPVPQPAPQMGGPPCPKCGQGQVVPKNRRDGSGVFYGCNRYPNCDYIQRG